MSIGDPALISQTGVAIRSAYRDLGAWATIGWLHDAGRGLAQHAYGAGQEQTFRKHPDAGGNDVGGIYVRDSVPSVAYWVEPDFWAQWQASGGQTSIGYPLNNKTAAPCPAPLPASCTAYQTFEGAYIWTNGSAVKVEPSLYVMTDTPAYRRLDVGGAWVQKGTAPAGANHLRYFGGGLAFHKGNSALYRSTDYGETWTTPSPPVSGYLFIDLDRCPSSGRVWALWKSGSDTLYLGSKDGSGLYRLPTASALAAATAHLSWTAMTAPAGNIEENGVLILLTD